MAKQKSPEELGGVFNGKGEPVYDGLLKILGLSVVSESGRIEVNFVKPNGIKDAYKAKNKGGCIDQAVVKYATNGRPESIYPMTAKIGEHIEIYFRDDSLIKIFPKPKKSSY